MGPLYLCGMLVLDACAAEPVAVFRFGTANVYGQMTNRFPLQNGSAEPMAVLSVVPSCDCLRILSHPSAVAAGETSAVEVLFVPDKVGAVDYRVQVKTSSQIQPDIEFAVQGVVTAAPLTRIDRNWTLYLWTDEAEKIVKEPRRATWVDVRRAEAHARSRIPDSLQMPLHAVKTKGFLKDRSVVLVDEGHGSRALEAECRRLRENGFAQVSILYGGMNAWRRLGGTADGSGAFDADRVFPAAMHDIAYSTDWLVVAAEGDAPAGLDESIAISFDASKSEEFVSALNAEIASRSQVGAVLLMTDTGAGYGALAEAADEIHAHVFFLEGGRTAWEAHRKILGAVPHNRSIVAQSMESGGGGANRVRLGGCGGCPK